MAIKVLPAFLILTLSWASCQNDAPQTDATQATTTETAAEGSATLTPATTAESANSPMLPSVVSGNNAATTPSATADAAKGSGKVNPPHGQPGHRCDIAVGAPLDGTAPASKPAATTAAQPAPAGVANSAPTTITPKPAGGAATPTTTAPGTNPPHGQPGHRCDIAVGAPLDSKPKQ